MESSKVKKFIELAGAEAAAQVQQGTLEDRKLGAQLLLSEVLEYIIKGLGLTPVVQGQLVDDPQALEFEEAKNPDFIEMLDGLADTAYTMYWNALRFGLPIEDAFNLVCDNNLEKFVRLSSWTGPCGPVERESWHFELGINWPIEVVQVEVIAVDDEFYAVGKDRNGKVRKPSSFKPLDLQHVLQGAS